MQEPKAGEWWWCQDDYDVVALKAWGPKGTLTGARGPAVPICRIPTPEELQKAREALQTIQDDHDTLGGGTYAWTGFEPEVWAAYATLQRVLGGANEPGA